MKLLNLQIELLPTGELLVNGRPIEKTTPVELEEKILRRLPLDRQWFVLCYLKKVLVIAEDNYRKARLLAREITEDQYDRMKHVRSSKSGLIQVPGLSDHKAR